MDDKIQEKLQDIGYYSRARNLLKCAKEIVEGHGDKFPAVDGNVMRVISRIYHIEDDIAVPKTKKIFEEKVQNQCQANLLNIQDKLPVKTICLKL